MTAACGLLLALVRRHVPAEGLLPWLRESFRSMREERPDDTETTVSSAVEDSRVADLLTMGEDGPAYHQAPDLVEMVGRRRGQR